MRGIILQTTRVRDDDLIVKIASTRGIINAYRFFGVRHSAIFVASHVDFELETSANFLPKMRNVMQILLPIEQAKEQLKIGQIHLAAMPKIPAQLAFAEFVRFLNTQVNECENAEFYEQLLLLARSLCVQESSRALVDARARLLAFFGEFAPRCECAHCAAPLGDLAALGERFAPLCLQCSRDIVVENHKLQYFLQTASSAVFSDEQIAQLRRIALI